MNESTIKKLEEAFLMGCSDLEACLAADISTQTLYTYQNNNEAFLDRKRRLKANPFMKARKTLLGAVQEGDTKVSQWMIDKLEGKAKQAMELTGQDGGPIQNRLVVKFVEAELGDEDE